MQENELSAFLDSLWLEDGLAKNTLAAYRQDMHAFIEFLQRERPAVSVFTAVSYTHLTLPTTPYV